MSNATGIFTVAEAWAVLARVSAAAAARWEAGAGGLPVWRPSHGRMQLALELTEAYSSVLSLSIPLLELRGGKAHGPLLSLSWITCAGAACARSLVYTAFFGRN